MRYSPLVLLSLFLFLLQCSSKPLQGRRALVRRSSPGGSPSPSTSTPKKATSTSTSTVTPSASLSSSIYSVVSSTTTPGGSPSLPTPTPRTTRTTTIRHTRSPPAISNTPSASSSITPSGSPSRSGSGSSSTSTTPQGQTPSVSRSTRTTTRRRTVSPSPGASPSSSGQGAGATSTGLPGTGVLPFTSTTGSSSAGDGAPVTWSGSFTDSPDQPTSSFPYFLVPTTTISGSAATSEAALLAPLLFALQANRQWITDADLKSQYIDAVDKTKDEIASLISDLDVPPPDVPGCSGTARKRSLMSEKRIRSIILNNKRGLIDDIAGLIGDVGKLLSCADDIIDNLINIVKDPVPDLTEIETLTDALAEIGEDLEEEDDDDNSSTKSSDPTSTGTSSCASTAVPSCVETISLSTSFISGTASYTVNTVTTTSCTTVTACQGVTTTVTSSTGTPTPFSCSPSCAACGNTVIPDDGEDDEIDARFVTRDLELFRRQLETPADYKNSFIKWWRLQVKSIFHANKGLDINRVSGTTSTAMSASWDSPLNAWVAGLYGCTSVAVVSRGGVWISHFWEDKAFEQGDAQFQTRVINAMQNGDGVQMTALWPLAGEGQILAADQRPQIMILSPLTSDKSDLLYRTYIDQIKSALTGDGAPFSGVTVNEQGYVKPSDDGITDEEELNKLLADTDRGKMMIQFDNNQDPSRPNQVSIWRVYMEDNTPIQEEWTTACAVGNQKRQDGGDCAVTTVASDTASATITSGAASNTDTGPITSPPSGISTVVTSTAPASQISCYPFADPDAGVGARCQCEGLTGYWPTMSSTPGMTGYDLCGYTTTPPPLPTDPPFTTTEANGDVVSCASSTYYNVAVNTQAQCAGATSVVSTVASIASAWSVSSAAAASSASAAAASSSIAAASSSWAAAAATPSASCFQLDDDGFGDLAFIVYGINGWAGEDGEALYEQEDGCGILSGWEWGTDGTDEFDGQWRDTQYAIFGVSFMKGGCIERAVHSAGGPEPGDGPGQIACHWPQDGQRIPPNTGDDHSSSCCEGPPEKKRSMRTRNIENNYRYMGKNHTLLPAIGF